MKRIIVIVMALIMPLVICACGTEEVEDNPVEETPIVEQNMLEMFISEYNNISDNKIVDAEEINITDQEGGHYRTEFRLGPFRDSIAVTATIDGKSVDLINCGYYHEDFRIYADSVPFKLVLEIIQNAAPILDSELTESDVEKAIEELKESKNANGYYIGHIGIVLSGYNDEYDFMLKLE